MATKDARKAHGDDVKKTDMLLMWPEDLFLVTDPAHPLYDKRVENPIDEPMVLNIMHHGVIEPVIAAKDTETGQTCVVDGRQRVMNAREANMRLRKRGEEPLRIRVIVARGESFRLMGIMMSSNDIRSEDSPINRAHKAQRYLNLGRTEEEVAIVMGFKHAASVKQLLALLDASAPVRNACEAGKIGLVEAGKLAKLPVEEQKEKLETLLALPAPGTKRKGAGRKRREVVNGEPQPRGKREIAKKLEALSECDRKDAAAWATALSWVLGEENQLDAVTGK